jgi:NADP-dependent 3-hydroxy acid dehydrogenase YdfG
LRTLQQISRTHKHSPFSSDAVIGEATALLLTERGAKVVLGARGADRLQALAHRIAASGGKAAYVPTDVKRRADLSKLVALAIERYGKLDVLVNNAGVAPNSLLDELRVEDWEEMIDINLKGVLYGIAAALPVFRRQGFGYFVNVISTAGIQIRPTMAVLVGKSQSASAFHGTVAAMALSATVSRVGRGPLWLVVTT